MNCHYKISVDNANELVYVVGDGDFVNSDAEQMFGEVVDALCQLKFSRVLIDNRKVIMTEAPMSIVKLIARLKAKKMFDAIKVARVIKLDCFSHEFVEQVANQKQVAIKNFDEIDAALVWLNAADGSDDG